MHNNEKRINVVMFNSTQERYVNSYLKYEHTDLTFEYADT
jgi:hypothetical protein